MIKKLVTLGISLLILVLIYQKLDPGELGRVFAQAHPFYLALSLGMVVPLTLLTSWRLQMLAPARAEISFIEANRLILVASVLNMVLPSKMGDIAKAYFMTEKGRVGGSVSLSLVVFEKTCDMLSLLVWCVFGLAFYPDKGPLFWMLTASVAGGLAMGSGLLASRALAGSFFGLLRRVIPGKKRAAVERLESGWREMQEYFWSDTGRVVRVSGLSLFLWLLHLLQIWLFILALRAFAPFVASLGLASLSILAGLLPLTFAGVGTRDAALILFYRPFFDAPTAAALGLLCTSRYLMPALAGLPLLPRYLGAVRAFQRERQAGVAGAVKAPGPTKG